MGKTRGHDRQFEVTKSITFILVKGISNLRFMQKKSFRLLPFILFLKKSFPLSAFSFLQKKAFYLLPFAFHLKKYFLLLALSFLLLPGCKFNPNMQEQGEGYLQGEWQQDTSVLQKRLVNYSLYHFNFSCDSVFVSIRSISWVNPGADSCMAGGHWAEYAKGIYQQKQDTLYIKGLFCNANHTLKDPGGCFRYGVYEENFKIAKSGDSVLEFYPLSSVVSFKAHLLKRNTCNPKPL